MPINGTDSSHAFDSLEHTVLINRGATTPLPSPPSTYVPLFPTTQLDGSPACGAIMYGVHRCLAWPAALGGSIWTLERVRMLPSDAEQAWRGFGAMWATIPSIQLPNGVSRESQAKSVRSLHSFRRRSEPSCQGQTWSPIKQTKKLYKKLTNTRMV